METQTEENKMKLITTSLKNKLLNNAATPGDKKPVLKLFNPCGNQTWLFTEMDESEILYGLCDLGFGSPELGYVALSEIEEIKLPFGLSIERDASFKATKTLSKYAEESSNNGCIAA